MNWTQILRGKRFRSYFKHPDTAAIMQTISGITQTYIYDNSQILTLEVSAGNILYALMDHFIPAA